jgi:hypothetical protein
VVAGAQVVFVKKDLRLVSSRKPAVQFADELSAKAIDPLAAIRVSVADKDIEIVLREEWHDFGKKSYFIHIHYRHSPCDVYSRCIQGGERDNVRREQSDCQFLNLRQGPVIAT